MVEGQGGQKDVIVRRDQGERSRTTNRAREYWIDRNAFEKFRVPLEQVQHPTIRQYVGLSNDTCCLRENAGAAVRNMLWHGTEKNARRLAEAEASGNIGSWEAIRASYPMRLLRAREVTEEATQCFEIGFGGFLLPYKIQAAVEPYGCTVREQAAGGNDEAPRVTPGSVWQKQEGVEETREFIPSGEPPPSNYLWRDHARLAPIPHFAEIAEREGFAGNTLTPDFVQEALAPLAPFGIAVIKMPAKQHGLP